MSDNVRQAARQIRLFLEDANRDRLSVALVLLEDSDSPTTQALLNVMERNISKGENP